MGCAGHGTHEPKPRADFYAAVLNYWLDELEADRRLAKGQANKILAAAIGYKPASVANMRREGPGPSPYRAGRKKHPLIVEFFRSNGYPEAAEQLEAAFAHEWATHDELRRKRAEATPNIAVALPDAE
jgi:hypothetical protein